MGMDVDVHALKDASQNSGVRAGTELLEFAEAVVMSREAPTRLSTAREALVQALGEPAVGDAAGVASNFERMVRIADATGIPLDAQIADASAEVRKALELARYEENL